MTQSTPDKKGLLTPWPCLCLGGEPPEPTGPFSGGDTLLREAIRSLPGSCVCAHTRGTRV